jgi:integrin alpha 2
VSSDEHRKIRESSELSFALVTFHQKIKHKSAEFSAFSSAKIKYFLSPMFQSTFQTVQLTAAAEIDTYNPQIFVIEENTVTVSDHLPT